MYILKLHRYKQDDTQSLSTIVVLDEENNPVFSSIALERGWQDNKVNVSCIPKGIYKVVLEYSNAFKRDLWEIKNVPNRTETKFHSSNYWYQLKGCIALGRRPKYLNTDKYLDVTSSKNTMNDFHRVLKNQKEVILKITTEPNVY